MNLYQLVRFFLPLQNPLGFGLSDFLELGIAALFVAAILGRGRIARALKACAARPRWSMALLFVLPILLRVALLPKNPAPIPTTSDDFAYVLLGDTLTHLRLANPVHPMRRFFETVFVLQEPAYSFDLSAGAGHCAGRGRGAVWQPLGGRAAVCGRPLRPDLLDAAGVGGAGLGTGGRPLHGDAFRPAQSVDQYLLGRRAAGRRGLPGLRRDPAALGTPSVREAALLGLGCGIQILTRPFESVLLAVAIAPPAMC